MADCKCTDCKSQGHFLFVDGEGTEEVKSKEVQSIQEDVQKL